MVVQWLYNTTIYNVYNTVKPQLMKLWQLYYMLPGFNCVKNHWHNLYYQSKLNIYENFWTSVFEKENFI